MKKRFPLLKSTLLAIVATVVSSALSADAQSTWNATVGTSVNTNWSTAANWLPAAVPTASSNVVFNDTGGVAAPGIVDNVIDTSMTIQQLAYRQTNGIHNTFILPGVTLTISNSVGATNLLAGTETTNAALSAVTITNTISGVGATLAITSTNLSSIISVRQINFTANSGRFSVLDMSGLDNFNASIGNVWVGVFPGTATTRPQGILFLAKTNTITALAVGTKTAPSIDVGDTGSSPNAGSTLALGITNNIAADTMVIGNQRSGGILKFNPAFTNSGVPSLFLRGHTGSRVNVFNIGDNSSATAAIGSACSGFVDFSGGTIDALVGSMIVGGGQPIGGAGGTGTATGTLTMTAGALNVNTMEIGLQSTNGSPSVNSGTVNINGGKLTVNATMRLALYGAAGGLTRGTLNITNGTVQASNIVAGAGTSTINMSGGTLIVTNGIGTPAVPLSALSINGGATLQLPAISGTTPVQAISFSSDSTGVINVGSLPALPGYPAQFPLIAYQGGSGAGVTFAMGTLPGTFQGIISNDNSTTIWLVVTNGPNLASASWVGNVNNLWDTSALNWKNAGNPVKYQDPDVVTFDDLALTNKVNVTATFAPAGWVQNNNTLNYIFSGAGSITGPGGLTMNGSASVTLAETGGDNFSGGISVNSGTVVLDNANSAISGGLTIAGSATVQIGNNDANGNLPAGAVDDEGTLIFNRTDNLLIGSTITGAGTLTQNGSGVLTLSGVNTYSGITTVNAGTLALTNSGSIANSAQINVTSGTLDVSGISGKITLNSFNLVNGGLTVSVGYLQTNVNVNSFVMGGTGNTLNVSSLPPIASYPTTLTAVQSPGSISGFNMTVGALPPGFTGSVSLSADTTAILLTLTSGPTGVRPSVLWSGIDALNSVNTNWSDNMNWQLPGAPVAGDNVFFNNTAAVGASDLTTPGGGTNALIPLSFNNIVDHNFTIASLTFTNNSSSFHNTGIADGAALNITNFFTVGAVDSASTLQVQTVNVAGGGNAALNVNNTNSSFQVWIGNTGAAASFATLDLSALDNFTANVSRIGIGACTVNNAVNRPSGILYLARTNMISCTFLTTNSEAGSTTGNAAINLGDCNQNQGPTSFIYLGVANTISADTIGIARQKSSGSVLFNPIYANVAPYPAVTFKGFSSGLVSFLDVGDGVGNSGTTSGTGDLNLTGGFVTAGVDTLNVGRASGAASGAGTTTGTLEFDAGTITANTLNIGLQPTAGAKVGVGTVTVSTNATIGASASLIVNGSLNLGVNGANTNAQLTAGTLNINGGTVQANNIVAGTNAPTTINLNGGTLAITGTAGTTAAPLTALNITDGTVLQLTVNGGANATNIVATSVTTSGSSQTVTLRIGSLFGVTTGVTYPLISYTGSNPFNSLNLAPLPAGYTGTLVDNSGTGIVGLTLTVVPPPAKPAYITHLGLSGTTLNLSATNGVNGGRFVLYGTTNVTTPLSQWIPVLTNNFDGSGNLNLSTNIVNPAVPLQFYILSQ